MFKKISIVALLLLTLTFIACGKSRRFSVVGSRSGDLRIDNDDFLDAEIYLDGSFLGTVDDGDEAVFILSPGTYRLSINFQGDGLGRLDYTSVRIRENRETFVEIEQSFVGLLLNLIFD